MRQNYEIDSKRKEIKLLLDDLRKIYYNDYIIQAYIEKLAAETEDAKIEEYIKNQYANLISGSHLRRENLYVRFTPSFVIPKPLIF